jgi:hypothetical protein
MWICPGEGDIMEKTASKNTKVSVNLAEQDIKLLAEVSEKTGMSMSDVIRHALGLERLAQEVREDSNKRLVLEDGNDKYLLLK